MPQRHSIYIWILLLIVPLFWTSCTTDVQKHPVPGVLRVNLQAAPDDTTIVMVKDTITIQQGDRMPVDIFQGKIFDNNKFFILYQNLNTTIQDDYRYNLLAKEDSDYKTHTIFETHLPASVYDTLEFGMTPDYLRFGANEVDIRMPEEESIVLRMPASIQVQEKDTTIVTVQIEPLESVKRQKNTLMFNRQVEISNIEIK